MYIYNKSIYIYTFKNKTNRRKPWCFRHRDQLPVYVNIYIHTCVYISIYKKCKHKSIYTYIHTQTKKIQTYMYKYNIYIYIYSYTHRSTCWFTYVKHVYIYNHISIHIYIIYHLSCYIVGNVFKWTLVLCVYRHIYIYR